MQLKRTDPTPQHERTLLPEGRLPDGSRDVPFDDVKERVELSKHSHVPDAGIYVAGPGFCQNYSDAARGIVESHVPHPEGKPDTYSTVDFRSVRHSDAPPDDAVARPAHDRGDADVAFCTFSATEREAFINGARGVVHPLDEESYASGIHVAEMRCSEGRVVSDLKVAIPRDVLPFGMNLHRIEREGQPPQWTAVDAEGRGLKFTGEERHGVARFVLNPETQLTLTYNTRTQAYGLESGRTNGTPVNPPDPWGDPHRNPSALEFSETVSAQDGSKTITLSAPNVAPEASARFGDSYNQQHLQITIAPDGSRVTSVQGWIHEGDKGLPVAATMGQDGVITLQPKGLRPARWNWQPTAMAVFPFHLYPWDRLKPSAPPPAPDKAKAGPSPIQPQGVVQRLVGFLARS